MLDDISFFYKRLVKTIFNSSEIDKNNIEDALNEILNIHGSIAVSLVDWENSMILGLKTKEDFDIKLASIGNSKVIRIKMNTLKKLQFEATIEDILITLTDQIHIIHILENYPTLYLYIALDSKKTNLALARTKVKEIGDRLIQKQEGIIK